MNLRNYKLVSERRKAIEKHRNVDLKHIGSFTLDEAVASTRNCENMIGATQVPVGVAGPLLLRSTIYDLRSYFIPLATTEGALVASVNRGCKAITESGGASVLATRVGTTRGPVFKVKNMAENSKLYEFVTSRTATFNEIAKTTARHITLMNVQTNSVGLYRFIRFTFDTMDAMGMNMVTIATQKIVDFIESKTNARCISLAGNYDVDKKPSWLNVIKGRGFEAWGEVIISEKVLKHILKTSAKALHDVWLAKCMIGSAMSGSMAFNAQYANAISALFLATGQDLGHVGEGSLGMTTTEIMNGKDLYVSIYLPDLMVGTVGGGTGLETQKEALKIIGADHSQTLAEVIAGAVLAGEISLLASLSEGTLAKAHQQLGRGGK
jgi:hydroxymethylglutaryl-CoA reductase (NADPH)